MTSAVVLGDVDLVRALGLAGIRSALFGLPDERGRFSRHVREILPWIDHWDDPTGVVDLLLEFAARQDAPPTLFPQTDGDLLALSRQRERLARCCRMALADAELVEDLVDKDRFTALAERTGLPVPLTRRLVPGDRGPADLDLPFPLVLKPLMRRSDRWGAFEAEAKALHVGDAAALDRAWRRLVAQDLPLLVQEAIEGPETRIESHHAYVDGCGELVADFTGRKIRTWPAQYGISTAVALTDAADVREAGRDVLRRIGLRGLAKADFKRAPDGRLVLLEVNPRATLWLHPAARGGCNLAAMVHADLTGRPRPPVESARPGVTWCDPLRDLRAARAQGLSRRSWLGFAARCDAISGWAPTDPGPALQGLMWPPLRRRLMRLVPGR